MDPVSIIAAATAAIRAVYSVTTALYTFVDGAVAVAIDQTTESFLSELKSLEDAITAIESCLEGALLARCQDRRDEPLQELPSSLASCLQNCEASMREFEVVLEKVMRGGKGKNPFRWPQRDALPGLQHDINIPS